MAPMPFGGGEKRKVREEEINSRAWFWTFWKEGEKTGEGELYLGKEGQEIDG